jgi:AcrR family transcriptional regulator
MRKRIATSCHKLKIGSTFNFMPPRDRLGRSTAKAKARPGYAKSQETRARILAAALEEASDSGIHETSLAAIAARAAVAIGSVNYHFGSREELLRELMASLTHGLLSRLDAAEASDGADFFERERTGLLVYLEHLRANPSYLRLAGEIRQHDPALYRRTVAGWLARVSSRIRSGIESGDLRPMDDAEIAAQAYFMLGANQFLDQRVRRDGLPFPDDETVVDAYLTLLRGGLGRIAAQPHGGRRRAGALTAADRAKGRERGRRAAARRA